MDPEAGAVDLGTLRVGSTIQALPGDQHEVLVEVHNPLDCETVEFGFAMVRWPSPPAPPLDGPARP
jgi:hypothetical protein